MNMKIAAALVACAMTVLAFASATPSAASAEVSGGQAVKTITVYSPYYGDYYNIGGYMYIEWETTGDAYYYDIDLYKGGVYQTAIASAYYYDYYYASYSWYIPMTLATGSDYSVVVSESYGTFSAESDYFTIANEYGYVTEDAYENDDTKAVSNSIGFNALQEHTIYPYGDVDWMHFTVSGTLLVEASIGPTDSSYLYLTYEIQDSAGNVVTTGAYEPYSMTNDEMGACLASGTYYLRVTSEYDEGAYSVYLSSSTPSGLLTAPTALQTGGIWGMQYESQLGETLVSLLEDIEESIGEASDLTFDSTITFDVEAYGYSEVTEVGADTTTLQTEVAQHLLIDATVTATGMFPVAGTYEYYEYEEPANQEQREVKVEVDFEEYFSMSLTTILRNSDLAVTENSAEASMTASGSFDATGLPDYEYVYDDYEYSETVTISYSDYSVSLDADLSLTVLMTYSQGLPLIRFPVCEGASWSGVTPMYAEGSYEGTVDLTGLPDEFYEEMETEEGITFPLDIATIPEESPGTFAEETEIPYGGACTSVSGSTYSISPFADGVALEGVALVYSSETGFIAGAELGVAEGMLDDYGFGDITFPTQSVVMIDPDTAKDEVASLRTSMDEVEEEGKLFCLSWFGGIVLAVPLAIAGASFQTYRRIRKH